MNGEPGAGRKKGGQMREFLMAAPVTVTLYRLPFVPHAVKLLPQPHPPVALGLLKVKPEPCIELT